MENINDWFDLGSNILTIILMLIAVFKARDYRKLAKVLGSGLGATIQGIELYMRDIGEANGEAKRIRDILSDQQERWDAKSPELLDAVDAAKAAVTSVLPGGGLPGEASSEQIRSRVAARAQVIQNARKLPTAPGKVAALVLCLCAISISTGCLGQSSKAYFVETEFSETGHKRSTREVYNHQRNTEGEAEIFLNQKVAADGVVSYDVGMGNKWEGDDVALQAQRDVWTTGITAGFNTGMALGLMAIGRPPMAPQNIGSATAMGGWQPTPATPEQLEYMQKIAEVDAQTELAKKQIELEKLKAELEHQPDHIVVETPAPAESEATQ